MLLAGVVAAAACGGNGTPRAQAPAATKSAAQAHDDHKQTSSVAPGARRVDVSARSFAFAPAEITVAVGEDIAIALTSVDSLHDFTVDEFGAHVSAEPGSAVTGGFRAGKAGRYAFYCSVAGHREAGMEGVLVVAEGATPGAAS